MFGCYRKTEANDPEVYLTAVIAVLSHYPPDIVAAVTDPFSGIPSKLKFLPTVAEIKAACEEIAGPRRRAAEWDARSREQLAERARLEKPVGNTERERIIDGFDKLLKYLRRDDPKTVRETPETVRVKYGLTLEQWNDLPDQPEGSSWHKLQGG